MLILGASVFAFQILAIVSAIDLEANEANSTSRAGKALSIFQIVRFKHDPCSGNGNRNGTCYSSAECANLGGESSGTCANGYGVCCIMSLSCGQTSSTNCTYLTQPSGTANLPSSCQYTICKCSTDICRVRLDFMTFSIAGPQVGTTSDIGLLDVGDAIGDCLTDSFQVALGEGASPGEICGFNTGQHMIYEPSDLCDEISFILGSGGMNREWDIKVTQYKCGDEDVAGPIGCLQYFPEQSGRISSFNFPTTATTVGAQTTHLSRQGYNVCIRRQMGACAICYIPAIVADPGTPDEQSSFGLDKGADTVFDGDCGTDFLHIPFAEQFPLADPTEIGVQLICGRIFSSIDGDTVPMSVCSTTIPFILGVSTGGDEFVAGTTPEKNELMMAPGGIVGFSLDYTQIPC